MICERDRLPNFECLCNQRNKRHFVEMICFVVRFAKRNEFTLNFITIISYSVLSIKILSLFTYVLENWFRKCYSV